MKQTRLFIFMYLLVLSGCLVRKDVDYIMTDHGKTPLKTIIDIKHLTNDSICSERGHVFYGEGERDTLGILYPTVIEVRDYADSSVLITHPPYRIIYCKRCGIRFVKIYALDKRRLLWIKNSKVNP